ncbi:supervillin isoform X11 [Haematobia irritans]|uniref:supervillin isoform X11 n=1 Tax=Haematobia irritans TaxID=7368 RepID=UPI003F5073E1
MFKFPLKRHHNASNNNNSNNQSSNHHNNSKSATSLSNEGFIFIRCGHNHLSNNHKILKNFTDIDATNNTNISRNSNHNNNSEIIKTSNGAAPHNNKYVAKSTVQSSWRPQLPLPKEIQLSNEDINRQQYKHPSHLSIHKLHQDEENHDDDINKIQIIESDMDRFPMSKKDSSFNGSQISNGSGHNTSSKKWSFGRLFRRGKKEIESESSSEDDRKAGFSPVQKYSRNSSAATSTPNKKAKGKGSGNRSTNKIGGFDHIVVSPNSGSSTVTSPVVTQHIDNEFFLPVETISPMGSQEPFYQNHPHTGQGQRLHQSQQYLPHTPQTQQPLMSKSVHSLDRRSTKSKQRLAVPKSGHSPQIVGVCSSSEEELISLNSSTFSKYRSDESIHSGGQGHIGGGGGGSRRSRAARNERYYKRLSRDGEVSHGQVPVMYAQQPTQRWKTQPVPLSIYQAQPSRQHMQQPQAQVRSSADNGQHPKLRNTTSLQHMAPYVQWNQQRQQQQPKNLQNSVNAAKRSISYDSQIHLQNVGGRMQTKPLPPPPPPRDPLRKVNISGHIQDGSSGDLRPISYAFDQAGVPVLPTTGLSGRCVSDDKIWAQHQPQYQSIRSLNIVPNHGTPAQPQQRRFITRADRDAHPGKKSLPNGLDFHYVTDSTPRSRKPIHMLEPNNSPFGDEIEPPPSSGVLRTTKSGLPTSPTKLNANEFWKRMEGSSQNITNPTPTPAPRGRDVQRNVIDGGIKPRSVSTSRVSEMRAYPMPMYSEVYKPNKIRTSPQQRPPSPRPSYGPDEVDGVVCGSLRIQPGQDKASNYVEIRNRDVPKSQSMPDHYHRRSGEVSNTPNKYEEYVNERREQHQNAPQPPQRKLSVGATGAGILTIPQLSFPRKKPANLEEAINELEAIYKSLGLTEPEPEVVKKDRVPTPNDFEKYALAHAHEYDDEDSPTGEPDPIRDDVAYRNIKLANLQPKTVDKQPPFGIPLGPIVPASQTDYLHVIPNQQLGYDKEETKAPDVVKDDLAVRALRKDPVQPKEKFHYPSGGLQKKNRATRTQSANIYALIQRDAAKPSGGDLLSYLELTKSIDRSESLSDLHKKETTNDIPSTLKLLQSLKEQESEQNMGQSAKKTHVPFRHPSQGGAICQLPEKLNCAVEEKKCLQKPVPMPRKSLTPEPQHVDTYKMEEALNKIAQDAEESSIKLTQELQELRKEALITNSKPKRLDPQEENIEKELQEIEKVSKAAQKCGKMLLDTLPDATEVDEGNPQQQQARKLHKEDKLIKAIDQVSEAANKVCEKILKDIVTTEPPVVVQEAVQIRQQAQAKPKTKETPKETTSALVMPTLIKKLDPIQSEKIEAIARRCMRQLSDLADNHDYDNLNQPEVAVASNCNLEDTHTKVVNSNDPMSTSNLTEMPQKIVVDTKPKEIIEEIDQIMKECEDQVRKQEMVHQTKPSEGNAKNTAAVSSTTTSSFSSSSDCLAKSSSPTASRRFSSSITSFNPYSSSDYIKSPSSDFHAPSTDRIKSCSTTSYDVQSTTSATPNITTTTTTSNFSGSPSPPPLNLTPVSNCSATLACSPAQRGRSSSPSQYNSSEELAMIFGIEEQTKPNRNNPKLQKHSGNKETPPYANEQRMPVQKQPLTIGKAAAAAAPAAATTTTDASPQMLCTANDECRSKTNPNECFELTLNASSSSNTNSINASNQQSNILSHSSSASCSSSSSRLETIPELGTDIFAGNEEEQHVKFSPNFNRIYASRVNIFVDKVQEDLQNQESERGLGVVQSMTQFDSLSSLEDNSSNPDSGNVSLADFPLSANTLNNSLQLSSSFNTRFEIRKSFKTEIAIKTEDQREKNVKTEGRCESGEGNKSVELDFPRLPTEEELLDSLRESQLECTSSTSADEFDYMEYHEEVAFPSEKPMGERIQLATAEIMAEVRALQASSTYKKQVLNEDLEKLGAGKEDVGNLDSIASNDENDIICESMKNESDPEESTFSEKYTSLQAVVGENMEDALCKRSVVFETPLLEMNILEEKINYEISIKNEDQSLEEMENENQLNTPKNPKAYNVLSLQELAQNAYEKALRVTDDFSDDEDFSFQNETLKTITNQDQQLKSIRPSIRCDDEQPSTSGTKTNKAVNILGEHRPNVVNGLTLLEHIVVACALGLITTNDIFTLFLIVIGIIIVIAIALF